MDGSHGGHCSLWKTTESHTHTKNQSRKKSGKNRNKIHQVISGWRWAITLVEISSMWAGNLNYFFHCYNPSSWYNESGKKKKVKVAQLCPTLCNPSSWNSPGQNTGVGSLSLLQGIIPTQGLNSGLPHCRRILYQLSYQGSPKGKMFPPSFEPRTFCMWGERDNQYTICSINTYWMSTELNWQGESCDSKIKNNWFILRNKIIKNKIMMNVLLWMAKCMLSHFSHVQLFETLWDVTHQAPLSKGFFRQEY